MAFNRQFSAMSPPDDYDDAVVGNTALLPDPNDLITSTHTPIANRVCTPLGLFIEPPAKGQGINMPQTLTPDSTQPSSSPPAGQTLAKASHSQSTDLLPADLSLHSHLETTDRRLDTAASSASQAGDKEMSPSAAAGETPPLHTRSVRAGTKIAQPKPLSRASSVVQSRPGTAASSVPMSSVAQLEATAEQLALTNSIDDAIRDLHGEMKRSDSRRSSILAANVKAANEEAAANSQLMRHLSTSSSIVSTNIAARHGGYSPAAFVMSPNPSHPIRLPTLPTPAKPPTSHPTAHHDADTLSILSRHGPGTNSVKSVLSSKLSLADISESEPTSLTQDVLDEADAAQPVDEDDYGYGPANHLDTNGTLAYGTKNVDDIAANDFHTEGSSQRHHRYEGGYAAHDAEGRPSTSHSQDTFQQAQSAFFDFDGVHCAEDAHHRNQEAESEAESDAAGVVKEDESLLPPGAVSIGFLKDEDEEEESFGHFQLEPLQDAEVPAAVPRPRPTPPGMVRPQSYIDQSGVQMLYYPARVPAQLNLPQKLSSKPKAAQRNSRQQKVLSAMMDGPSFSPEVGKNGPKRASAMPNLGSYTELSQTGQYSPNLESHSERRASFISLPAEEYMYDSNAPVSNSHQPEIMPGRETRLADTLRVPQRLTRTSDDKRKSKASVTAAIPSHLRASAYFDQPSTLPDIELKNGSAMCTLESILDASASAPVSAFTDHLYAGKLGSEVYGKNRSRQSLALSASQEQLQEREVKKRSSFMWRSKRSTSYNSDADGPHSHAGSMTGAARSPKSADHDTDEENVIRVPAGPIEAKNTEDIVEEDEDEDYEGPPTTLLAELQLRKQQQKDRLKKKITNTPGSHATLLELDAIAETQRVDRKSKRITLAWEDPDAHLDQNGSDDEDVPLAIIAAKHQGAKNMADLERPIGLMERREIEDNEPLSQRRARLQGRDVSLNIPRPTSALRISPSRLGDVKPPQSVMARTPDLAEGDVDGVSLAGRSHHLALDGDTPNSLPPTRPVSRAFSAELLSQFGDLDDAKAEPAKEDDKDGEEETLGQRRRRLRAEKAARDQEMSFSNAVDAPAPTHRRQMSLSSMLSAHPRKSPDLRVQEELRIREEEERAARERDTRLAPMKLQTPSMLSIPSYGPRGGYLGGAYNDGSGGNGLHRSRPVSAHFPQPTGMPQHGRHTSGAFNAGFQQAPYGGMKPYPAPNMQPYGVPSMYGGTTTNGYGMPMPQAHMQMQMPMMANNGQMDRVEMWRQGVQP